ncbi:MAG: helix-turn-helix transcriptional regulator [Spirochaetes bacterium]|nr:helix-turn-helix transcriptional regulator [Spirochaetota bacterium]
MPGLEIISCDRFPGMRGGFRPHRHEREWEFHFFTQGRGVFINGALRAPLRPATLFFSRPGVDHASEGGAQKLGFCYVRFTAEAVDQGLLERVFERFAAGRAVPEASALDFFAEISAHSRSPEGLLRRAAGLRLEAWLHACAAAPDGLASARDDARLEIAVEWLKRPGPQPVALAPLCAELGMAKSHFIRLFRRRMGVPPLRYAMLQRMEAARYLLESTDLPIHRVAETLGYEDAFYFSRVFHRANGSSPRAWRDGRAVAPSGRSG